jgi:hypothetical protein
LWLAGFPVDVRRVRSALKGELEGVRDEFDRALKAEVASSAPGERGNIDDAVDRLADQLAGKRGVALPRLSRQDRPARARAFALMIRLFLFEHAGFVRTAEAYDLERLMGLQFGRRDRIAGADPWLQGSPARVAGFARVASLPALFRTLEDINDRDLERARRVASRVISGLASFSRILDTVALKRNAAGLAGIQPLPDPVPMSMAVLAFGGMLRTELRPNIETLLSALRRFEHAVELASHIPIARVEPLLRSLPLPKRGPVRRFIASVNGETSA